MNTQNPELGPRQSIWYRKKKNESCFNSQHMIQTVSLLQSVQNSSQVHTVEKISKGLQWQGHKVGPQPVPKGKMGGATLHFPQALTSTFTFTLHKLHDFLQEHF